VRWPGLQTSTTLYYVTPYNTTTAAAATTTTTVTTTTAAATTTTTTTTTTTVLKKRKIKFYLMLFTWMCSLGCHCVEITNIDCDRKFLRTVLYYVYHLQKHVGEKL
jgi:hypothetical protein